MEMLVCPQCGKEFEKHINNHKFCSEYCGKKYRKKQGLSEFRPEKVSKEDLDEIKRLYENGATKVDISKRFGVGKMTLNRYLNHILTEESHYLRSAAQMVNKPHKPRKPRKQKQKPKSGYTFDFAENYIKRILSLYISPNDIDRVKNSFLISELYADLGGYYSEGLGSKEISEILELPVDIVKKCFTYLPSTFFYADRKELKDKEKQELEDLVKDCYEEGLSGKATAEKTGLNPNTISKKFRALDLTDSFEIREQRLYEDLRVVYDLWLRGYTQESIMQQMDFTPKQVELRMSKFRKVTPIEEMERLEKQRVHKKIW